MIGRRREGAIGAERAKIDLIETALHEQRPRTHPRCLPDRRHRWWTVRGEYALAQEFVFHNRDVIGCHGDEQAGKRACEGRSIGDRGFDGERRCMGVVGKLDNRFGSRVR